MSLMKKMTAVVFLVVAIVASTTLAAEFGRNCSSYNVSGQANFTIERIAGTWYHIESYSNTSCTTTNITAFNSTVLKISYGTNAKQPKDDVELLAIGADNSTGKFTITQVNAPFASEDEYYVVTTDYDNYSVGWSCYDVDADKSRQNLWILSRNTSLSSDIRASINETLATYDISQRELFAVEQNSSECVGGGAAIVEFAVTTFLLALFACMFF